MSTRAGAHERIEGLDAIRGCAAFGVLVWHYKAHFSATPLQAYLLPFFTSGGYMVDVFFVLSGFLLGRLYRERAQCRTFLWKRIIRLFPLHWTTLVIVALLQQFYFARTGKFFIYQTNDLWHFVLNLGLLQNVGLEPLIIFSFNGPAWSISIEWATNLIFVVVLLFPRFRIPLAALLAVGSAVGCWVANDRLSGFGALGGWLPSSVLRGVYGFFTGVCLTALLPRGLPRHRIWDAVGIGSGGLMLFLLAHPMWLIGSWPEFALVGVLTPVLIASCSHGPMLTRVTMWRPLVWLGDVSFSVYLWHFPVQLCLALLVARGWRINYGSPAVFAVFLGLTYLIGDLSWRYLERPIQRAANGSRFRRLFVGGAKMGDDSAADSQLARQHARDADTEGATRSTGSAEGVRGASSAGAPKPC